MRRQPLRLTGEATPRPYDESGYEQVYPTPGPSPKHKGGETASAASAICNTVGSQEYTRHILPPIAMGGPWGVDGRPWGGRLHT